MTQHPPPSPPPLTQPHPPDIHTTQIANYSLLLEIPATFLIVVVVVPSSRRRRRRQHSAHSTRQMVRARNYLIALKIVPLSLSLLISLALSVLATPPATLFHCVHPVHFESPPTQNMKYIYKYIVFFK